MLGRDVGSDMGRFLVFLIEGDVVDGGGFPAEIRAAGHVLQLHHFHIFHQGGGDIIDVGELIAFGIDFMIVGIAFEGHHAAVALFQNPGIQAGDVLGFSRVLEIFAGEHVHGVGAFPVGAVHLVEHVNPDALGLGVVVAHDLGVRRQEFPISVLRSVAFHGVILMEALEIMSGLENIRIALPARDGEMHRQSAVGVLRNELKGPVVHHFHPKGRAGGNAAGAQVRRHHGGKLFVKYEIVEPEQVVLHGHRFAVGPPEPLAQGEGEFPEILAGLVAFHDIRRNLVAVGRTHGQKRFVAHDESVGVPVDHLGHQPQGSAILADFKVQIFVQNLVGYLGMLGQTLFHRRQLALLHQLFQHGCFAIGSLGRRRQGQHPRQENQAQYRRQLPHDLRLL